MEVVCGLTLGAVTMFDMAGTHHQRGRKDSDRQALKRNPIRKNDLAGLLPVGNYIRQGKASHSWVKGEVFSSDPKRTTMYHIRSQLYNNTFLQQFALFLLGVKLVQM